MVELRYVDARFSRRLPMRLWALMAIPLSVIVVMRGLRAVDALPSTLAHMQVAMELALVAMMIAASWRLTKTPFVLAAVVPLVVGVVVAPTETLLTLALLHNLTPLGFLVEKAPTGARVRTFAKASLVFFGAPLLSMLLAGVFVANTDAAFPTTGALRSHLGVYLWPSWQSQAWATQVFSAAVCAQLLHYGAVILWLPRTLTNDDVPSLPWPKPAVAVAVLVVLSVGLALHFAGSIGGGFAEARMFYALPAAVHAWIELPILLVSLTAASNAVARER